MRRTSALAAAAAAALLATICSAGATASPSVVRQAWAKTGVAGPPNPKSGNLYVATAGGQEQARTFVRADVSGLDAAALAASSIVLAPASDGIVAEQPSLIACALATPLAASGELGGVRPQADCSLRADLVPGSDGTWTVPLAVFGDVWASRANNGLAILPDPDAAPTVYSVSLEAAKTALRSPTTSVNAGAGPARAGAPTATLQPQGATVSEGPAVADAVSPVAEPPPASIDPLPAVPEPASTTAGAEPSNVVSVRDAVRNVAHPSALLILVPVLLAAAAMWVRSRQSLTPTAAISVPSHIAWKAAAWAGAPLVAMTLGETTVYKLGLVAIAFVAAIGLHLLVNWAGELSLAHAAFIGVPAFAVAQVTTNIGLSPLLGLPVALAAGVGLGCVVGVAALRSRGLQVALVTLAIGIAVVQFLFFRTWFVGSSGGVQVAVPSLFGVELRTSRSLVPVLVAAVLLAVLCAMSIMRSKVGRALLLMRSDPDAAAAAGIAVARHRGAAYAMAGGFAGTAGWLYVVWVQQVSAKAFPLQLGFTYLVIAALAGPGGLSGVVVAAVLIQGGSLFAVLPHSVALYLAPIALILNVTRYQAGFNGLLQLARRALASKTGALMTTNSPRGDDTTTPVRELRPLAVLGTLAVVAGFSATALAWYHMGNTDAVWVQNQELMSGGVGGLGLVLLGATLLLRDALLAGRARDTR